MESRRPRRSPAIVLRFVAILAAGLPAAIAAGQATPTPTPTPRTVSISPTVATISFPATTTTVDVNIDNASGAKGYLIQIAYDNEAVVQETAVSDGLGTLSFGCLVVANFACAGGSNGGNSCLSGTDCPGGTCVLVPVRTCAGGSNGGNSCAVNGDCPGGTCLATVKVAAGCSAAMSGSGTLFHITFTGLANGSSNLVFTECQLTIGIQPVACNGVGGEIVVSGYPPPSTVLVCDVAPSTGSDFGQFGNGVINNADVVTIFRASLLTPPPAGSALFSAMDSAPADTPPTCGGNSSILNNDVVACFKRSLLGGPNFTRTYTGGTSGTCTSAQQ